MATKNNNKLKPNITNLRRVFNKKDRLEDLDLEITDSLIPNATLYVIIDNCLNVTQSSTEDDIEYNLVTLNMFYNFFVIGAMTNIDQSTIFNGTNEVIIDKLLEFEDIIEGTGIVILLENNLLNFKKGKEMLFRQAEMKIQANNLIVKALSSILQNTPTNETLNGFIEEAGSIVKGLNVIGNHNTEMTMKEYLKEVK